MPENLEIENIQQLLAEADDLIQQINSDAIKEMQEEQRLQVETERERRAKVAEIDEHWATVGSSNLDPFSLLLSLEANVIVDDGNFAKELKYSLEQAVKMGAGRVYEKNLRAQTTRMRLVSWLSYGLVRFLIGIAGYAPEKSKAH